MMTPEQCKSHAKIIQYGLDVAFHSRTERGRIEALNEVNKLVTELLEDAHQRLEVAKGNGFEI